MSFYEFCVWYREHLLLGFFMSYGFLSFAQDIRGKIRRFKTNGTWLE